MRVSAKADYAVRAALELVSASEYEPLKADELAERQAIPARFLENILGELRQQGVVHSRRGADGGYWLALPPAQITIADVIRAVEGPLASVRGERPDEIGYQGTAEALQTVWVALRANIRGVLETVTLADVISGQLGSEIVELARAADPRAAS